MTIPGFAISALMINKYAAFSRLGSGRCSFLMPATAQSDETSRNYASSRAGAVASYRPNGYGLYYVAGNVFEWTGDG